MKTPYLQIPTTRRRESRKSTARFVAISAASESRSCRLGPSSRYADAHVFANCRIRSVHNRMRAAGRVVGAELLHQGPFRRNSIVTRVCHRVG